MTSSEEQLLDFVASSFSSVWALETLLLLKSRDGPCSREKLVASLRASDLVVAKALDSLFAAGLASQNGEEVSYLPLNAEVAAKVEQVEKFYRARPDVVRRAIVSGGRSGATAFANAFKLRKD